MEYLNVNFPNFVTAYTDSSVFSLSAGYSVHISALNVSRSAFVVFYFFYGRSAIIEALFLISDFPQSKYLIVSDSTPCLQSINLLPFI